MKRERWSGWSVLDLAVALAVLALILVVVLQTRRVLWSSQVEATQTVVSDFAEALAQYERRHGHLPGDANRDAEIDASESVHVVDELARAGLIRSGAVEIAGKTVTLRVIAAGAGAVRNPPRGRNVLELWNLPCHVARELDEKIDDGNFAKGSVRANVAFCAIGGENDPVPTVAVALPR